MEKSTTVRGVTSSMWRSWRPVLLIVSVWFVYLQVRTHEFVCFDDPLYISGNSYVVNGLSWENIAWAFSNYDAANWHPLTWLSHMLDVQLFGLDSGWHALENVLLHTFNVLLVYVLLKRLGFSLMVAFVAAFFFGIHAQNVEAVAWISQRKSLLNVLFTLLSLVAYLRYGKEPKFRYYGLAYAAFLVSLLAKSMSVTLPVILLMLDVWPLNRIDLSRAASESWRGWMRRLSRRVLILNGEKLPFWAASLWISYVTVLAQDSTGAVVSIDKLPLWVRNSNAVLAFVAYLKNAVFPSGLSLFYSRTWIYHRTEIIGASMVILVLAAVAVWTFRRARGVALGYCWFAVTLLPVIGLVQVGSQARADRYFYFPSMGLCIMLAALWGCFVPVTARIRRSIICLFGGIAIAHTAYAYAQVSLWKSGTIVFADALDNGGDNTLMLINLSASYYYQGRVAEAIATADRGLQWNPDDSGLRTNRASYELTIGNVDEAFQDLKRLASLNWVEPRLHLLLAMAYYSKGNRNEAERSVETCRRLLPIERSWQLSIESIKEKVDPRHFKLEDLKIQTIPLLPVKSTNTPQSSPQKS